MTHLRQDLFQLAAEQGLDADQARRLHQLAGLQEEPANLDQVLPRGVLVLASALLGLGLVMWVAANWDDFGRAARFVILQGLLVASAVAAAGRPAWRAPLALLALICIGALYAYFGQTYQTGADAWQLFALWAALGMPLALAVRSDVVWAPWTLVSTVAVALWVQTHTGHRWRVESRDLAVYLLGLGLLLVLSLAMSPPLARWTGAGLWAQRCMTGLAVLALLPAALVALFADKVQPQYIVGLGALAAATALLSTRRGFEVFALSAVALALDVLLLAGLAHWLFSATGKHGDPIGEMLVLGLVAAALLAASVHWIMRLTRRAGAGR